MDGLGPHFLLANSLTRWYLVLQRSRMLSEVFFESEKTLRGHPGSLQYQVPPFKTISQQKVGQSPSTLIQIYKQCVRPIFEYDSLSTITTSDNIISKIQRLQNKFIWLALRLPKYICPKLLHDCTGLPYVKDRLLSCATKYLDRIAQNPLVEESISHNRLNPAWDRFPTPLTVVRPGKSSV